MDYRLAALKMMSLQLKEAKPISHRRHSLPARLDPGCDWRADDDGLILDDGTGVFELSLSGEFRRRDWRAGMYVMVIGGCFVRPDDRTLIKVHKMVDLSLFPDQEAMWCFELLEAYQLFYKRLIED